MKIFNLFKKYKIIRFCISGALGFMVHVLVLFVLVEFLHIWYLIATSLAFLVSVSASYFLQKIFTFKHKSRHTISQFLAYFVLSIFNFFLNILIMYILVDILGIMYLYSQAISSILNAILSYLIINKFIFNIKPVL
jgi:putative flippase GtrA